MIVNAYIMLADPAWIESSLMSYYHHVSKIVVTYDENNLSWSGTELSVGLLINRIRSIDVDGKCEFFPGHFSRREYYDDPMINDTNQRNISIGLASTGADWVVQLDTDEVLPEVDLVFGLFEEAEQQGCEAIWFPQRWLFQYPFNRIGLEWCKRGGKRKSVYAGPIAIRPWTEVILARRTAGKGLHVNRRGCPVAPHASGFHTSKSQIDDDHCLLHMSHVRKPSHWRSKIASWGHSKDFNYTESIKFWMFSYRFPLVAMILSHLLRQRGFIMPLRITRISKSTLKKLRYNNRDGDVIEYPTG